MIVKDWGSIRLTDPHRHKYASAMAEYLDACGMNGGYDRQGGSSESPTGYFTLYGRRILRCDDRGFIWVETWPEPQAAEQVFDALEFVDAEWSYDEWCDDHGEERTEDEQMAAMDDAHAFCRYTMECAEENLISFDIDRWRANDRPKGPLG